MAPFFFAFIFADKGAGEAFCIVFDFSEAWIVLLRDYSQGSSMALGVILAYKWTSSLLTKGSSLDEAFAPLCLIEGRLPSLDTIEDFFFSVFLLDYFTVDWVVASARFPRDSDRSLDGVERPGLFFELLAKA